MRTPPIRMAWAWLAVGLMVAGFGVLHTLWALPEEIHELRPSAHHGLGILGLFIVVRAFGEITHNLEWLGEWLPDELEGLMAKARDVLLSRPMRLAAGLLVTLGGIGEAWQAYEGIETAGHFYGWGVALLGLMVIARAGHFVSEGMELLHHVDDTPGWLRALEAFFARPLVHLGLALTLMAVAVLELMYPGAVSAEQAREMPGAPLGAHALALVSGVGVTRALVDVYNGLKHGWELRHVVHAAPGHGHGHGLGPAAHAAPAAAVAEPE